MVRALCLSVVLPTTVWAQTARSDFNKCEQWSGDEAIAACTRAIQSGQLSQHDLATMFNDRGVEWRQKGELDKAMMDYDQALRIQPIYAQAHNNRGNVWNLKGEYDKAIAEYDESIRNDPNFPLPYGNRADIWRIKGEYDKAIADYNAYITMKPSESGGYCGRSKVWKLKQDADKTAADEQRCKELGGK